MFKLLTVEIVADDAGVAHGHLNTLILLTLVLSVPVFVNFIKIHDLKIMNICHITGTVPHFQFYGTLN